MDRLWWENITNTSHFIDQIVEAVQSGSHLFLQLPQFVPWYETMSDLVISKIERQNSDRSLKIIMDSGKDPGEYLFYQYCRQEKRAQYRPGIGYAQFLAKSEELMMNHYILWVTQADAAQAKKWYNFLEGYSKALGKGKKGCIFLIETRGDVSIRERGGIKRLVYEKEIAHYDTYLFAMLAASTQKQTEGFRQYLAEAVSSVVPDDAELACACIQRGRTFLEDPVKTIASIKKETFRSDKTAFWPDISEKQIAERMWEAQIKVVFPIIEKQRSIIVERYRKGIEALLPITGAYGEMFYDAEDVEIGVLSHLVSLGRLAVAFEDGKMIAKLRNARNTLAHIKPMTQTEIDEIL